uniref:Toll-like receptor 18 n=1 Tax=Erpetoichthys calabaricus TaxID=27687 RepID=A0A8C4RFA3_ERPCA
MSFSVRDTTISFILTCIHLSAILVQFVSGCRINGSLYASCKGLGLHQVPSTLPDTLQELDLSYNKLVSISNTDFSNLRQLHKLNLQYNNISFIADHAFANNTLLEDLNIFNNSLAKIPSKAFEPLKKLKFLEMSNNFYSVATLPNVFSTFNELKVLSMGGPLIQNLSKYDFYPLKNISLNKFAIKSASSLHYYEQGTLSVIQTTNMWFDIALDQSPRSLPAMLQDFTDKTLQVLRFRNLFEFTYYTESEDLFNGLRNININQLIFYRGKFNENLLRMALLNVQRSTIKDLGLVAIDFARSPNFDIFQNQSSITDLSLNNLVLQDISNPDILRFDWKFTWFSKVVNLTITNVNFNFVPCDAWDEMSNIEILTITNNRLLDGFIYNQKCRYDNTLPSLRSFIANVNMLTSLAVLSNLTAEWKHLQEMDLSYNQLGSMDEGCAWKASLTRLILHHNSANQNIFRCLPETLEYLDLSYCDLDLLSMDFFQKATELQVLLLSGNKIKFIPSGWQSPNLQLLAVDGNSFGIINTGTFHNMPNLVSLKAGNNPYYCTCDLYGFVEETVNKGKINITDWPQNYRCYQPENLLNTIVAKFYPGKLTCNVTLVVLISVSTTAVVVIILMILCYIYDVHWYLKAIYQILRAKYRARKEGNNKDEKYEYHAFISYSHSDAEWVRNQLLPRLENCDPPYRLCIHERDFMPGKWIIDNIIENIEKSHKVMFILSHHFVNSEWCNYELYFTHQRAIGKPFNDIILIVKEIIDPESLPNKYCKLKKMLRSKTYLEWPLELNRQVFFWAQLRSILGSSLPPTGEGSRHGRQSSGSVSVTEVSAKVQTDELDMNGELPQPEQILDDLPHNEDNVIML